MKEKLEDIFKEALNDFELPYENGAWEAFESRLKPVKTPRTNIKWLLGGGSAALVAGLGIFFFLHQTSPSTTKKEISVTTTSSKKAKEKTKSVIHTSSLPSKDTDNKSNTGKQSEHTNANFTDNEIFVNDVLPVDYLEKHTYISETTKPEKSNEGTHDNNNVVNPSKGTNSQEKQESFKIPHIENQCKGETIRLENTNTENLGVKSPSGKLTIIYPNSKADVSLNEAGSYEIGKVSLFDNNFVSQASFKVQNTPSIQLSVDEELSYENGLPTIKAEASSTEDNISWKSDKQAKIAPINKGKNAEYLFFRKGQYEITAQTTNNQGCKTQETKTINVEHDYNLLAMNAFNPNSLDSRNNTFIPYALKVRNTPFRMVIIDPDNGGIVFETTDASQGWDGIDRRDGKMVNATKTFMWKVTLSQPEAGEKPEYKGTIIRIYN